jgi:quercetin dioxygenase-like cupin family protein
MSAAEQLKELGGDIMFFTSGGVEAKVYGMPAMTQIDQHVHDYDHMSFLVSGDVTVVAGTKVVELTGPAFFEVKANTPHRIIATTPALWACIHNADRLEAEGKL